MERLTRQGELGPYWDKCVFSKHGGMEEDLIIDRLAHYEDTGLTPEEIKTMQEYHDLNTGEDVALSRHLLDLIELGKQGRLVELPVTVGDTVYEVQQIRRRIQPMEIISAYIGRMGELYFYWELKDGEGIYGNVKGFGLSQLGKTVFRSRPEAEAALAASGKEG